MLKTLCKVWVVRENNGKKVKTFRFKGRKKAEEFAKLMTETKPFVKHYVHLEKELLFIGKRRCP